MPQGRGTPCSWLYLQGIAKPAVALSTALAVDRAQVGSCRSAKLHALLFILFSREQQRMHYGRPAAPCLGLALLPGLC